MRLSGSPPSVARSDVGSTQVDPLHLQLQEGLETPRIEPQFSCLKQTGAEANQARSHNVPAATSGKQRRTGANPPKKAKRPLWTIHDI
jgi:hypothetical protein